MSINKAEQAVAFAALILADDSIAITPEKLQALLKAAGVEDIEPIWTTLFAKALEGKDVKDILTKVAASAPAVGGTPIQKPNEKDETVDNGDMGKGGSIDCGRNDSDDDSDIGMSLFD